MRKATSEVIALSVGKGITLRDAAYEIGVARVAEAEGDRGHQ
jgi:glutamate dehydrogenase/leucine dehydrogenase